MAEWAAQGTTTSRRPAGLRLAPGTWHLADSPPGGPVTLAQAGRGRFLDKFWIGQTLRRAAPPGTLASMRMNRFQGWARLLWAGSWVALAATLVACGGGSGATVGSSAPEPPSGAASVPSVPGSALRVLMLGNSHTVYGGLPSHLEAMLRAIWPGDPVLGG